MNLATKTCSGCLEAAARQLRPQRDTGAQPLQIIAATDPAAHPKPGHQGAPDRTSGPERSRACARNTPSRAAVQVRSRFRPAFPDCLLGAETPRPAHACYCSLARYREAPQLQVIPPLPRNAGPIARPWAGISGLEARPRAARASQAACRLAGAAGAGARFLLGVGGARAAEAARRLQVSARTRRGCSRACVHERRAARARASPRGRQRRSRAAAAVGRRSALSSRRPPPPPNLSGRDPCPRLPRCQSDPRAAAEHPALRRADLGRCGDEAPCGAPTPEPAPRGPAARAPEGRPPTRRPPARRSA